MRCRITRFNGFLAAFAMVACLPTPALALTLRYALIVGNNRGMDSSDLTLPPLKHAEDEARLLRAHLIEVSNFDPSPERTILLLGATRNQLKRAVQTLREAKDQDRSTFGPSDTLFAFFFTGHGLQGRLLLDDGPLAGEELGQVFRTMAAEFTVGVFDACYSGSLDPEIFRNKGIEPTPGLNLFRELPEEVLAAEGSIFFVSSGPDQASYEDEQLGGVFTHFFIEGLRRADRDGPGITLERIWHYAREHTVDYTAARQRRQTPQQYVASLKAQGPLYFSFPLTRSATLALTSEVNGRFLLSYAEGQLTEVIEKPKGVPRELAVYPGKARLSHLDAGEVIAQDEIHFAPNATVVLHTGPEPGPRQRLGETQETLWEKGVGDERLVATRVAKGASLMLGGGYDLRLSQSGLLAPMHVPTIGARLDFGGLAAQARLGYGFRRERFSTWGYEAHAAQAEAQLGYGFDIADLRLGTAVTFAGGFVWERFKNQAEREGPFLEPGLALWLLYPTHGEWAAEISLSGGLLRALGAGVETQTASRMWGGLGLTIWRRLL